jgi:hypothetical protein
MRHERKTTANTGFASGGVTFVFGLSASHLVCSNSTENRFEIPPERQARKRYRQ